MVLAGFILTPVVASAATANDIIKKAIRENVMRDLQSLKGVALKIDNDSPEKEMYTLRVEVIEKYLKKGQPRDRFYGELKMGLNSYPLPEGGRDEAVAIDIPIVQIEDSGSIKKYEHPISLEFRVINQKVFYFRVTHISDEVKSLLESEEGASIDPLLNVWIKVDLHERLHKFETEDGIYQTNLQSELAQRFMDWYLATEKKFGSPMSTIRSQKSVRLDSGDFGQTVSIKFNPKWYTAVSTFAISEYKHFHPDATKREIDREKKDIASMIKDVREIVDRIQTQVTVNLTAENLLGFSAKYSKTEPTYLYSGKYVKNKYVSTKKVKGSFTVNVGATAGFSSLNGQPLEIPSPTISPEEAWKLIQPKNSESSSGESTSSTDAIGG